MPRESERPLWLVVSEKGLYTGILVVGAVGTGKTTACMYPFAKQLLSWRADDPRKRAGGAGRSGLPVGNRTIAWDPTFLMTVLNWAARSRDEEGRLLLDSNPLKGLRKPREKNPNRVVLTEDEYRALLGVSRQVGWRFHVALVLAHETGHRIGAIRELRWPDIDFEGKTIRWRAEHEKTGYEHITPL